MSRFLEALNAEIAALEAALEGSPIYMKLREAQRLRNLYVHETPSVEVREAHIGATSGIRAKPRLFSGKSLDALEAAKAFLAGKERPTPTVEVMEHLESVGITFGGSAPQNTVSSILSKSPDFKSNGRAGWTLTERNLADDENPAKDTSPANDQPQNAPVDSGEEVAHEKITHSILD